MQGILDDAAKVCMDPLYLKDTALLWWRRRCDDVHRGVDAITTWDGFDVEVKGQFQPTDAEDEARAKLRQLQHKNGHIHEYVREFSVGVQDITQSMATVESLFEFQQEEPGKDKGKKPKANVWEKRPIHLQNQAKLAKPSRVQA
ncbi:Retrotransposon gag domain [Dillenia turbinata]|uniref:Retrotransposon gag domain n=1 Tax=Dillenia turbinata TaxID=194707 RepID=A0AAN8URZ7_9MAGN